uniref:G_PROTEIN_RECEP_F1_2 domain-containing protein n=2 Tax=Caenorhabditis tropicalis TaxID=1561998 RepID=A0A1I7UGZ5_9PELO
MTNAPCPDIIPSYYPLTLHIIAVISAPINLIGFYLVVFQSPKMQGYKYCLCYLQTTHQTLYIKKFFLLLTHIYPFAAAIAMWNSNLTQEQRHVFMKENWPQCVHWLSVPSFEIYYYHLNPMLSVVGIGAISLVFIVFSYCTILGIHTMSILQKYRKSMSRQMYQMHKNALFSLAMQIMIPAILVVIPLGFCLIVVITGAIGLQGTNGMFSKSVVFKNTKIV